MTAERLQEGEAIELDGILDEPVWDRAAPATDFIQQDPDFGGTPTERTEVRIVFTAESLYMGVSAFDSEPDLLLGNTMKRDEFLRADDRFMWTMDTFLDQHFGMKRVGHSRSRSPFARSTLILMPPLGESISSVRSVERTKRMSGRVTNGTRGFAG
jgi:hypothetical protein